jgi:hypothetical protein
MKTKLNKKLSVVSIIILIIITSLSIAGWHVLAADDKSDLGTLFTITELDVMDTELQDSIIATNCLRQLETSTELDYITFIDGTTLTVTIPTELISELEAKALFQGKSMLLPELLQLQQIINDFRLALQIEKDITEGTVNPFAVFSDGTEITIPIPASTKTIINSKIMALTTDLNNILNSEK